MPGAIRNMAPVLNRGCVLRVDLRTRRDGVRRVPWAPVLSGALHHRGYAAGKCARRQAPRIEAQSVDTRIYLMRNQ
jgi:hypothetical protein